MGSFTVDDGDVNVAKQTISRSRTLSDDLFDAFEQRDGEWVFAGTKAELRSIRAEMRSYEKNQATVGEDKAYYDARFVLQFIPIVDETETYDPPTGGDSA